jgi:hypothetical protein
MSVQQPSRKAFISVVEMAEEVSLSKSRFFALMKSGVFPRPTRHESCKRPVFNLELQQKCLEIRATGIGLSGQPVIFNRMRTNGKPRKQRQPQPAAHDQPIHDDHSELVEAMKSLGLTATNEAVGQALTEMYPAGVPGDHGEVIRRVFLHLRAKK